MDKYIAEGTYGIVYKSCDLKGDCNYVLKIQVFIDTVDKSLSESIAEWKKEALLVKKLSEDYDIGAKFIGAWMCGSVTGIIVSKLWDGALGSGGNWQTVICPPKHLVEKLENQVRILHDKLNLVHADILPKNILIKKDSAGVITDITLTDFGMCQSPAEFQKDQKTHDWIKTLYDYHFGHLYLRPYYFDKHVSLQDVIGDPKHLDFDLLYYFRKNCL